MKFQLITTLSLFAAAYAKGGGAGKIPTCADQHDCFSWDVRKLETPACTFGGEECIVEVCMVIDTTRDNCAKKGGTISHVCDASDQNGCPNGSLDSPIFDTGDYKATCPGTLGQGNDSLGASSKCNDVKQLTLCQQGLPGKKLHFILKDGQDETLENTADPYELVEYDESEIIFSGACDQPATVTCSNNEYSCGQVDQQKLKERTWTFAIPEDKSCFGCGESTESVPLTTDAPEPEATSPPETESAPLTTDAPEPEATSPPETESAPVASSNGDPHFKTWKNEHFEYHGQCDLILAKDPSFANGIGLEVQIRTKLVRFWSYIKSAAIRIGDDILEVEGSAEPYPFPSKETLYWINLQHQGKLETLGGFPVKHWRHGELRQHFVIDLSSKYPGQKIEIATYREFVRVDFQNGNEDSFGNAVGMLGDFKTGKTVARDGATELHDFYEFGNEWQVLPFEHMLFHNVEQPQFPSKCIVPEDPQGDRRRRLGESTVSEADAEKACAAIKDALDRKDCVYDILATQDLGMVGAY